MQLTLEQAATRLGKTVRQVRYMVEQGRLLAKKVGGRWLIDAQDLPRSEAGRASDKRRDRAVKAAVERALGVEDVPAKRYSLGDLKAFRIAMGLQREVASLLGADHRASVSLTRTLECLALGCHRFEHEDKVRAYKEARDQASLALCALFMADREDIVGVVAGIEQDLMAAFSGLLRRYDRKRSP